MRLSKEEGLRWLEQAEHNLQVANNNLKAGFYSDTCFMSEQTAQVALKAFIIYHGRRYIWEHSIQELVRIASGYDEEFKELVEAGKILDRYYIPTRYPDALASPAIPYKSFIEKDALEAIGIADRIVGMVRKKIGGGSR
jgi:HEPN domain-containing protein